MSYPVLKTRFDFLTKLRCSSSLNRCPPKCCFNFGNKWKSLVRDCLCGFLKACAGPTTKCCRWFFYKPHEPSEPAPEALLSDTRGECAQYSPRLRRTPMASFALRGRFCVLWRTPCTICGRVGC
ncbi:hypothetical protein GWI33_007447 [Rhynchophorus ferrugineus]|uniref:Uncharacterized protein n=1 Tax=Rhynchophorus ferrugineus TaxID=354439 RepID=A0A834IK79_RHYFE|nr:hypothetical protein GWI33_007447 [Rhynchophorus ferrugineus]